MTWPPVEPSRLDGRYVTLVRLRPEHAAALHDAADDSVWTYLGYGPFASADEYRGWVERVASGSDPLFLAVLVDGEPRGVVSYLRMEPDHGVVEIGHIWYAPSIQRTRATTEVTYLLARHVFDDLGYRRLEWKCNARNARSRAAAERFGFTYEGRPVLSTIRQGHASPPAWRRAAPACPAWLPTATRRRGRQAGSRP